MGNAESNPVKNVDKRTVRRDHAPKFAAAIVNFRGVHADAFGRAVLDEAREEREGRVARVRVCVRRRPIFPHELKAGEFDVLTCSRTAICVHDGRVQKDCRSLFFKHHTFVFDRVFDERTDSAAVYTDSVSPLVRATVDDAAPACVLMYGQTGSGKTFTMSALIELAATELFELIDTADQVTVTYTELAGSGPRDMLNGGEDARLMTDRSGEVQVVPQLEVPVESAEALLALIRYAQALRATAATGVHDASSRSHAVCTVHVRRGGDADEAPRLGSLALIDLAGSEQRIDTDKHSAVRTKESAMINSSLMALKDGVRAISVGESFNTPAGGRQALTQLLRPFFTAPDARTLVLAAVSPASKDTEHALNTLRHASLMDGRVDDTAAGEGPSSHIGGGSVVVQQLGEIDFAGTQARLRAQNEALRNRALPGPSLGGGGDGVGADAERNEAVRRDARAQMTAFSRTERAAAHVLAGASAEAYAALLAERGQASVGPRLNRYQEQRMAHRVSRRAAEAEAEGAGSRQRSLHQRGAQKERVGVNGDDDYNDNYDEAAPPRREKLWAEDEPGSAMGGGCAGGRRPGGGWADAAVAVRGAYPAGSEREGGGGSGEGGRAGSARHGRRAGGAEQQSGHPDSADQWPVPAAPEPNNCTSKARQRLQARSAHLPDSSSLPDFSAEPPDSAANPQPRHGRRANSRPGSGAERAPACRDSRSPPGRAGPAEAAAGLFDSPSSLVDKVSRVRQRREAADAERRTQLLRRQESKGALAHGASDTLDAEIRRLQGALDALPAVALHAQARAGLGRQLAARKAAARREQLKHEAAARACGDSGGPAPLALVADSNRSIEPARAAPAQAAARTFAQLPPKPPPAAPPYARVVYTFKAQDGDELTVTEGERVEVLADDGECEWIEVANAQTGALGLVPRDCLDGLV